MRFRFLPRLVIALDADRRAHAFRIGARPDGALRISALPETAATRPARGFILALDPTIGYFRAAQMIPRSAGELASLASDMFPFDPATIAYCASSGADGKVRYHALPTADLEALTGEWRNPSAVIIAPPESEAILAAITARIDRGGVADLLSEPARLVPPAAVFGLGLASLATAGIVAALMVWNLLLTNEQKELRRESARLEAEAAPILKQRQAILRMTTALKEHAVFSKLPAGRAFRELNQLLAKIPEGGAIESFDLAGDTLSITGTGPDAQGWFTAAGVQTASLKIESLPKLNRFQATISLKDDAAPGDSNKETTKP